MSHFPVQCRRKSVRCVGPARLGPTRRPRRDRGSPQHGWGRFSTDKRFEKVQTNRKVTQVYKTVLLFVYSHRAAAHQYQITALSSAVYRGDLALLAQIITVALLAACCGMQLIQCCTTWRCITARSCSCCSCIPTRRCHYCNACAFNCGTARDGRRRRRCRRRRRSSSRDES